MTITAFAPSRIDLTGGTLDIYPLYLFEEGGLTVNMGISIGSRVRLVTREDDAVRIVSEDTGAEQTAPHFSELDLGGELDLLARIIRFYKPRCGIEIFTRNDAPKGSGLGASSSLLIALSGALRALNSADISDYDLVEYGADLEAQSIGIPTGKQDYYAAIYGGINAIWFNVGRNLVEPLEVSEGFRSELERRLVLSFTGEPHYSAITNWGMLKAYIDNLGTTRQNLEAIKATSFRMREALLKGDFSEVAAALAEEWENRKRLAEGVSTPTLERMIAAAAEAGAIASKVCGAGGGGCMITLSGPDAPASVRSALEQEGALILDYRTTRRGLFAELSAS